ncbi:hypothetical protein AVEN_40222-1 [Araneus ventricosus]|uniref:Uncharacterized protein n=1 Tax=Araneus ventricosus TaxID=182803 RepID=A0A4Y2VFL7_ARAVE|nr:hypothetical protein AVEN_40222-1 [Araneus ventricosus]
MVNDCRVQRSARFDEWFYKRQTLLQKEPAEVVSFRFSHILHDKGVIPPHGNWAPWAGVGPPQVLRFLLQSESKTAERRKVSNSSWSIPLAYHAQYGGFIIRCIMKKPSIHFRPIETKILYKSARMV